MEILLKDVRLSFPTLGEPEQYQGKGVFRWGASLLAPKGSAMSKAVDAALLAVAKEKWGAKKNFQAIYDEIIADKKACCWVDGNKKDYDGYQDQMAISAYRYADKGRPIVIDNDMTPIYKADNSLVEGKGGRLFAGCYVNAKLEIWAQDNKNGNGLRATLMAIQRVRTGDSFGGGAAPSVDGFEAVEDGADASDDMT